jgi:hypothetical protein
MIDKMIRCKDLNVNDKIECLCQWFKKCPPKGGLRQWRDGRSAKETAKHWVHTIPSQFKELLSQFNLNFRICSPEFVSKFDKYGNATNGRNHDLLILAKNELKKNAVISIESKADETFGDTISGTLNAATIRLQQNPRSNGLRRIEKLRLAIFGNLNDGQLPLRYQILTALAGTLAEAKIQNATKAIFIVQIFLSDEINLAYHNGNQNDLNRFVDYLTHGLYTEIIEGELIGPIRVPGNEFIPNNIDLWIGKYEIGI